MSAHDEYAYVLYENEYCCLQIEYFFAHEFGGRWRYFVVAKWYQVEITTPKLPGEYGVDMRDPFRVPVNMILDADDLLGRVALVPMPCDEGEYHYFFVPLNKRDLQQLRSIMVRP